MDLLRTSAGINYFVGLCSKMGLDFSVRHGTYTTQIITPFAKKKFLTHKFSNKVFAAAAMIKRDVLASEKGREIMSGNYARNNYSNSSDKTELFYPEVKNIDINSAYATCLMTHNLITEKTFDYIRSLKKDERLPCVGMLAQSSTEFVYENGICVDIITKRAATYQVFYFLISEINYLMRDIEFELGPDFVFYWVDGIFFLPNTPKKKIETVEGMILEQGYGFKYETVQNFSYNKIGDKFVVEMTKNGDFKRYEFQDSKTGVEIGRGLHEMAKASKAENINETRPDKSGSGREIKKINKTKS